VRATLDRIPEHPHRVVDGREMISPAVVWERINTSERP
jgi:hypothetical protein